MTISVHLRTQSVSALSKRRKTVFSVHVCVRDLASCGCESAPFAICKKTVAFATGVPAESRTRPCNVASAATLPVPQIAPKPERRPPSPPKASRKEQNSGFSEVAGGHADRLLGENGTPRTKWNQPCNRCSSFYLMYRHQKIGSASWIGFTMARFPRGLVGPNCFSVNVGHVDY